jgi:ceramide glucosyltransferase
VIVSLILSALVTGSLVYCVLTVIAAMRYAAVRPADARSAPPISILKPLAGVDDGLEVAYSWKERPSNGRPG